MKAAFPQRTASSSSASGALVSRSNHEPSFTVAKGLLPDACVPVRTAPTEDSMRERARAHRRERRVNERLEGASLPRRRFFWAPAISERRRAKTPQRLPGFRTGRSRLVNPAAEVLEDGAAGLQLEAGTVSGLVQQVSERLTPRSDLEPRHDLPPDGSSSQCLLEQAAELELVRPEQPEDHPRGAFTGCGHGRSVAPVRVFPSP